MSRTSPQQQLPLPTLRLVVNGIPTTYLLEDPGSGPRAASLPDGAVYDLRIHAAWVLARQGHRTSWLATHLGLPRPVARAIVTTARPTPGPPRPPADRAFGLNYFSPWGG
ncbi:hypothetical protein ACWIG3_10415 [Streptomyces celluloflavus]